MDSLEKAKVLVIGAGPAGVGVATGLARRRIKPVILIDRHEKVGGVPALYKKKAGGVPTFVLWTRGRLVFGEQIAERLTDELRRTDVEIRLESQVVEVSPRQRSVIVVSPSGGRVQISAEAVVLACGAREKTLAERGWIVGSRPRGLLFTKNMLDWVDRQGLLTARTPVILGSDVIAHAAAAKLKSARASDAVMVDRFSKPACRIAGRLYFGRWTKPAYRQGAPAVSVVGGQSVSAVRLVDGTQISCDGVMLCGELVPNSELALMGGLQVDLAGRRLLVGSNFQLSEPGWFAAGNILGDYHGAQWCYYNGRRVARHVAKYLSRTGSRSQ